MAAMASSAAGVLQRHFERGQMATHQRLGQRAGMGDVLDHEHRDDRGEMGDVAGDAGLFEWCHVVGPLEPRAGRGASALKDLSATCASGGRIFGKMKGIGAREFRVFR
jgi:hypothetical protein